MSESNSVSGNYVNWPDPYSNGSSDSWSNKWNPAGWFNGTNFIKEKFNDVDTLIDELMNGNASYDGLQARIEALKELDSIELPEGWEDNLDITIDPLVTISKDGLPPVPTLSLPDDWPTNIPILGFLKEAPDPDLSYTEPTVPDDVDPTINYTERVYISDLWDVLYNAIYDGIENGGTGLAESVETALWDRARERQRLQKADAYQRGMDAISNDGFDFASGAQAAFIGRLEAEWAQQDTNLSNEIAIKQAELAQVNTHFMLDKGVALDQILRQFHNDRENRTLDAEKTMAQFILQKYSEKVKLYIASWEGVRAKLEVAKQVLASVKEYNDVVLARFKGEWDSIALQTEVTAKKISALVEGFKGEIDGYRAQLEREEAWWKALSEEQRNIVMRSELLVRIGIEKVKAILDSTVSSNTIKERIAEAVANITAQVMASALNAINVSLSDSSSQSKGISEGWSHGESLDENHNYTHTE